MNNFFVVLNLRKTIQFMAKKYNFIKKIFSWNELNSHLVVYYPIKIQELITQKTLQLISICF